MFPQFLKDDKEQIFEVNIVLAGFGQSRCIEIRELEAIKFPYPLTKVVYYYTHGKTYLNILECYRDYNLLITLLNQSLMLEYTRISDTKHRYKVRPEVYETIKVKMGIES